MNIKEEIFKVKNKLDINVLSDLAEEIWREHFIPIIGKKQVIYMLNKFQSIEALKTQINDGVDYYIIKQSDDNIGYFAVKINIQTKSLQLSKIYIKSEFRRKGIANNIIIFIENICQQLHLKKIWLVVNKYNIIAINAYLKYGFQNKGEQIQNIGGGFIMDDYLMEKEIKSIFSVEKVKEV